MEINAPVSVLVAAFNEEQGIAPTLLEIKKHLNEPDLVVVDGKSTDKTMQLAKDLGAKVFVQTGSGKGNAIAEGFSSLKDDVHYVVLTDADYTYPAKHIKEMIKVLDDNAAVGMVLGDRFNEIYKKESDRNQFYIGNRILGFTQRLLNGVKLNDPYTGLRIIRSELVKGWKPKSDGFDIEAEINHHITTSCYKIAEVPIKYRKRVGKKKLGFLEGLKILRRIVIQALSSSHKQNLKQFQLNT